MPPLLLGGGWSDWVQRGLIFLVVSCPCALVISVPLSFFGGIGGASRLGILVKGSNYLETLSRAETVVFDKTGTLTDGSFNVVAVHPASGIDPDRLLSIAAHAEAYSNHPIALSVRAAYSGPIDQQRIDDVQEQSGHGVRARVDEHVVYVGNDKLMSACGVDCRDCELTGTILHVSLDGEYIGHIVIADVVKPDAAEAVAALRAAGVKKTVMLTGDRADVAAAVAKELGIDEFRAQLLPQDKVAEVEKLLEETHAQGAGKGKLAFVGDGINDAPVLTRADIGIAMGAMGSDAAIEAADVVLMDDKPSNIARAIRIARKTMGIVWQNIVFALGVKFLVLILAARRHREHVAGRVRRRGRGRDRHLERHARHERGQAEVAPPPCTASCLSRSPTSPATGRSWAGNGRATAWARRGRRRRPAVRWRAWNLARHPVTPPPPPAARRCGRSSSPGDGRSPSPGAWRSWRSGPPSPACSPPSCSPSSW